MNEVKRERLAEYAHEAWSGWMKYLFEKSVPHRHEESQALTGDVIIPRNLVERWKFQMRTSYEDLPEEMKPSDRDEADKMISIFEKEN